MFGSFRGPITQGGASHFLLEEIGEVILVVEMELFGDLLHGKVGHGEVFLREAEFDVKVVFVRRDAKFFLEDAVDLLP